MLRRGTAFLLFALCLALTAAAQMPMQGPPAFRGVWSPVVGSGAAYSMETKGEKRDMEIAIVGTEQHEGRPGHWMEVVTSDPRMGQMVMKMLLVLDGSNTRTTRMIFQTPQMGPFEMSMEMMGARGGASRTVNEADFRKKGEKVGTETITTPAGTFTCEHYRNKEDGADVWISEKVAPYGLVKMTGRDVNMTLTRVITGARTRITGTPQKFDPRAMMGERP